MCIELRVLVGGGLLPTGDLAAEFRAHGPAF